jgi:hypothetical protein
LVTPIVVEAKDPHSDDFASNAAYLDEVVPALETLVGDFEALDPTTP